jgi:hypothetical protein
LIHKASHLSKQIIKQMRQRILGPHISSCLTLTDQKFLALFSLPEVANPLADGNLLKAKAELLKYYQKKISTSWLPPPKTITDLRLNTERISTEEILDKADEFLEFKFAPQGSLPKIRLDGTIDWDYNPVSSREWILRMHRHQWWVILGLAYAESGDERYARAFVGQMLSWVSNNPLPSYKNERSNAWRLMETGLRLRISWIPCFALFFDSVNFTDNAKLIMLRSIYDQANFLSHFKTRQNHLLRESNGLASAGIYFSEFKEAKSWVKIALSRFDEELKKQINQDGSQIEMSIGYQWLVADEFDNIHDFIQKNELSLPQENLSVWLEKMFALLAYVMRPDGSFPEINDGFIRWTRERLEQVGRKFNRDDLLFIGTDGEQGSLPEICSIDFGDAGFYVMRSDWNREARYLFFDAGPYGGHHGHEDKLSIEVYAFGRPFIVDSGSYTYEKEDPYRNYFVSSYGHNTILVDGRSQIRRWHKNHMNPKPARGNHARWISQSDFDYVASTYNEGYGCFSLKKPSLPEIIEDVIHTRRIFFVKPDYWIMVDEIRATDPHDYQLLFHTPPELAVSVEDDQKVILGTKSDHSRFCLLPVNSHDMKVQCLSGVEQPIQGWFSVDHHIKVPSTTVIYEKKNCRSTTFTTLLCPVRADKNIDDIFIKPLQVNEDQVRSFNIRTPNGNDDVILAFNNGLKRIDHNDSVTKIGVTRRDHNNHIIRQFEGMTG